MLDVAEQLQKTDLFQDIHVEDLAALAKVMQHKSFKEGEVLFNMGDQGDAMYIITKGRVRIYTLDEQQHELTLMYYGQSQIFGEFSLLDNKPRSASAMAADPLEVLVLNRNDFMGFLLQRPGVSLAMMRSLSQRARYTTTYLEEVVHWAKRLAKGEYQQALEEISQSHEGDRNQIQGLVAAFMQMVKSVQEREQKLKQELVRLQVQIDQEQRKTQVHNIVQSDFFANLKAQARELRSQTAGTDSTPDSQTS